MDHNEILYALRKCQSHEVWRERLRKGEDDNEAEKRDDDKPNNH